MRIPANKYQKMRSVCELRARLHKQNDWLYTKLMAKDLNEAERLAWRKFKLRKAREKWL